MRSARVRRPWTALALHAWLALCLLLAQGLGQGHRVAHLGFRLAAAGVEQAPADGWGHTLGSTDCQLFDQLAHGDQIDVAEATGDLRVLAAAIAMAAEPASAEAGPLGPRARDPPLLA